MKTVISEDDISRLIAASHQSTFRTYAECAVIEHFRSIHYLSSTLVCDAVVLNLALNSDITPHSADRIITVLRRRKKSLYTTVESAYFPIEDRFEEYARSVLGDDYNEIKKLDMRITNYIVYVISLDLKKNCPADSREVCLLAYSYE